MNRYISILSALLTATLAAAQTTPGDTINRTVLVESTYNPIVVNAVKRNFIPDEVEPSINKTAIVYADDALPITRLQQKAIPAKKVGIEQEKGFPGYIHLGYGNSNNLDGWAAYHLQLNENNALSINAGINGWNGNLKRQDKGWWHSYLYDGNADIRYRFTHRKGELGAALTGGHQAFNYLTVGALAPDMGLTDQQHSNLLGANIYAKGLIGKRYRYDASLTYTHLGQQAYLGKADTYHGESLMHTQATFSTELDKYGTVTVGLSDDLMSYSSESPYKPIHYFTLTPQWSTSYKQYHFVAGVNLDLSISSNIRMKASPACSVTYNSGKNFNASLLLDGGYRLPTYAYLASLSPYWMRTPELQSSYTYLNTLLTSNMRLTEGLHLTINGGYRVIGNAIFETVADVANIRYTSFENRNAQLLHASTKLSYDYKQQFSYYAQATYNHWIVEGERAILARAPQLDMQTGVQMHILKDFTLHSDFRYLLFSATVNSERERAIIDWGLGMRYALNTHWTFFLDGHNLLNHHHQIYTGYPTQGIHALAGATFKF